MTDTMQLPPLHPYQHDDPAIGKAQELRILDMALLGPAMLAIGVTGKVSNATRWAWVIGAFLTIGYNAANYNRVKRAGLGGVTLG